MRKICIVGHARSTKDLAPYDDESVEIWSLGTISQMVPRWTRAYELHNLGTGRLRWKWSDEYWKFLTTDHGKPLIIGQAFDACPHGQVYPWQQVLDRFGTYFNNSVSLMIGQALLEGCDELSLYGVDMMQSDPSRNSNGEYEHQRPSCEYMLGIAIGLGVNVKIPEQSDLLKTPRIYALESDWGAAANQYWARKGTLGDDLKAVREKIDEFKEKSRLLELREHVLIGAANENEYHLRTAK